MKLAIRTDSSHLIGTGHVMRCLTLADALKENGAEIVFICRDLDGNINDLIKEKGHKLIELPKPSTFSQNDLNWNHHASWLGVPWEQDAEETTSALKTTNGKFEWLIVDHYALDRQWEEVLRPLAKKIMIIDDIADRIHDCNFLLDHNLYHEFEKRYDNLVPKNCRKLLGPSYCLLRPEFKLIRSKTKPRNGEVKNIFIFMGGADQTNETLKVLNALKNMPLKNISISAVMASTSQNQDVIKQKFQTSKKVTFLNNVNNMAELMGDADLAIGGGGVTSWERCCVFLPSIVIALAENQVEIAKTLKKVGAVLYLGSNTNITSEDLEKAITELLNSPDEIRKMSECAGTLVNGNGLTKIINHLNEK